MSSQDWKVFVIVALCVHVALTFLSNKCVSISQRLLRIISFYQMTVAAFAGTVNPLVAVFFLSLREDTCGGCMENNLLFEFPSQLDLMWHRL